MDFSDLPPLVGLGENNSPEHMGNTEEAALSQNESDFDDSESDEEIDIDLDEQTKCLFCDHVETTIDAAIKHVEKEHRINLSELKLKFHMDQYSFLKFINCIRLEKVTADQVINASSVFWSNEKYLKPVLYEPWLTYDYESLPILTNEHVQRKPNLEALVLSLREQLQEKSNLLEQAHEDIKKMRVGFQRLFTEKEDAKNAKKQLNCVSGTSLRADNGYFTSYAHFGIHHEMLSDVVRTTSYRDALLKNKSFIKGKDVLDVGSGTAVLSIFASQAGAKNVVGIDNSDIIYNAMDIVKNNNITNVQLVKGRLEDTQLPQEKYDVIISEWMGYFLLFEGMLDSIIYARDKHLQKGGILLPNRCTMSIVGYGNESLYRQYVTFWDDVYGLNMSNMRKEVMHEPLIEIVDPKYVLTEQNIIADLDLATVDLNYSNFSYQLNLRCLQDGILSSFVGYFDTFFDLPCESVHFGTGPNDKPTHWKQVVFFLNEPRKISTDEVIKGKLVCRRSKNSARSLDIEIDIFDQLHTYYLD